MTRVALLKSRIERCGGLEKIARKLCSAFRKKGCDVRVLTTDAHQQAPDVINLCKRSPLTLWDIQRFDRKCRQWLASSPCDIVFGLDRNRQQTHYRAGNGCHAAYLRQRSLTDSLWKQASFRINPLHRTLLDIEREAFESPQLRLLITNSYRVKNEILEFYRVDAEKIHVIHNGTDWLGCEPAFSTWQEDQKKIRASFGLDGDAFQLLFIGQGYRRKGLQFLLRGLAQSPFQDWQLAIVGKDRESKAFQHLTHRLGLASRVRFLGPQSGANVTQLYQQADALAIPSSYDPFANVTTEALAMGLYVLSSSSNGGSEILTSDNGCIIEALSDPDSMVQALNQTFAQKKTPESARRIRAGVEHLDEQKTLSTLIDLSLSHAR